MTNNPTTVSLDCAGNEMDPRNPERLRCGLVNKSADTSDAGERPTRMGSGPSVRDKLSSFLRILYLRGFWDKLCLYTLSMRNEDLFKTLLPGVSESVLKKTCLQTFMQQII